MLGISKRQRGQYLRRKREREGRFHLERRVRLYLLRIVGTGYEMKLYTAVEAALRAILLDGERNPCESLVREWCAKVKIWAEHAASWFHIRRLRRAMYLSASLFGQKAYAQQFERKFSTVKHPRTNSASIHNKEDINNRHPTGVSKRAHARHRPPAAGICRLAAWIARKELAFQHEMHPRVAYSFPHAFNFALKWLKAELPKEQIIEIYVRSLRDCHATASDLLTVWSPSSTVARANRAMAARQQGTPESGNPPSMLAPHPPTVAPTQITVEPEPTEWWSWFCLRYPHSQYARGRERECRDWAKLPPQVRKHILLEYRPATEPIGWWTWFNQQYPGNAYGEGGTRECRVWKQLPIHVRDLISDGMSIEAN